VLTEAFEPGVLAAPEPGVAAGGSAGGRCTAPAAFRSLSVTPSGPRGLRLAFRRMAPGPVRVDVFRQSGGRTVLGNQRVARLIRTRSFRWSGRRGGDGVYVVRARLGADVRRFVLLRRGGRFVRRPAAEHRPSCGLLSAFALDHAAFGGRRNRALGVTFRVRSDARVVVEVLRGRRVVRRYTPAARRAGVRHRLPVAASGLRRGEHRVRLTVAAGRERAVATLTARRL
jgi:hypothetical protein